MLVQRERQVARGVQHVDRVGEHFELAGAHLVVDADAPTHGAGHAQNVFVTDVARDAERFGIVGIGDDLDDALVIAKIDEDDSAVVAARVDPSAERDGPAEQGLVDETAVMGTHGIRIVAPDGAGKREMLRSLLLHCNVDFRLGFRRPSSGASPQALVVPTFARTRDLRFRLRKETPAFRQAFPSFRLPLEISASGARS